MHGAIPPREGSDWYAVFNPKVKRVLDVQLVRNLMHERCGSELSDEKWCCVRFSSGTSRPDATGPRRFTIPRRAPKLGKPWHALNHLTDESAEGLKTRVFGAYVSVQMTNCLLLVRRISKSGMVSLCHEQMLNLDEHRSGKHHEN